MIKLKFISAAKRSQTVYEFKKAYLKAWNRGLPILLMLEEITKKFKVIKLLGIKCVPVTGIARGIVIAHNNKCLLVRYGDYYWSRWSINQKHFRYNRNKIQKIQERCLLDVFNDYSNNHWELLQSSGSVS